MDEPRLDVTIIAGAMIAIVLAILWWRGVFSRKTFEKAPPREGSLGLFDVAIVLGLLIVCGIIAGLLLAGAQFVPTGEADAMLLGMAATYLASIPALVYLFLRVTYAMPEGLRAFGFGIGNNLPDTARITILGIIAIFPLTFGALALASQISLWLGDPGPQVAHDTLRILRETTGPTAWGLIFTAVVLAPIFEEILFRGLLQTSLRHSGLVTNRWLVIVIATALFVPMHFGAMMVPEEEPTPSPAALASITFDADPAATADAPAPPDPDTAAAPDAPTQVQAPEPQRSLAWQALPGLIVLSLGLGYLYERTGSLWPPILVHVLFNASQITIALNLPDG